MIDQLVSTISSEISALKLNNTQHFLFRNDGICFFSNSEEKNLSQNLTALMTGVWQASKAMFDFLPEQMKGQEAEFKLSFETSSQGVFIQPLQGTSETFYYGVIYSEILNPGPLKQKIRNIKSKLHQVIIEFEQSTPSNTQRSDKGEDYLFKDISDDEIDNIFCNTGN